MTELALYRKWRSQAFEELVGQLHITRTLHNAVASGKVAHAYLFCGPRGTGKTSTAKILTKALNCEKGPIPTPCNECAVCLGINNNTILDCIEIDAASNRGIDEIRDLREKIKFSPTQCRTKVYIIDEVHMLTQEAFNALLKTLEEPPPRTVFILCTTEPHKLPPTVISRCQRFDFKRIPAKIIEARLEEIGREENLPVETGVLTLIARNSEGSLRDAINLLDQLRTFCSGKIRREDALSLLGQTPFAALSTTIYLIAGEDLKKLFLYFQELVNQGLDAPQLIRDLLAEFRKMLLWKISPELSDCTEEEEALFSRVSGSFSQEQLYRILRIFSELRQELRYSLHPQLSIEISFVKLIKAQWEPTVEGIKKRVELLEKSLHLETPSPIVPNLPEMETFSEELQEPASLDGVKRAWSNFLDQLRHTGNMTLSAILQEAQPIKLEGDVLSLGFPSEFRKKMMEQKQEEVEIALKKAFRRNFILEGKINTVNHASFLKEATETFQGALVLESKDAVSEKRQ